jgi:predicted transcriptional regulator
MAKVGKRTTEQAVLEAMVKVEKPVTVAYLERTVGMHYSTAIKVLDEMIKEKLVKKLIQPESVFMFYQSGQQLTAKHEQINDMDFAQMTRETRHDL